MPRETQYFFGRLNLAASYDDYDEKAEILIEGLTGGNVVNYYGYKYTFVGQERFEDQELGTFLTGRLVKFKPVENEEVIDLDEHKLANDAIENKTAAKIRFFLHVKSGLIVHHAAGRQVRADQFRVRFGVVARR